MNQRAVCISCFHYYDHRIRLVEDYLLSKGYDCTYIISDFSHKKSIFVRNWSIAFRFQQNHIIKIYQLHVCVRTHSLRAMHFDW